MGTQNSVTHESKEPFQQSTTTQLPQGNRVNLNKILFTIVGILAVGALVVGGYYLFISKQTKQQVNITPTQSPRSAPKTSPTSQTQIDQFAGWKTYENEQNGFLIKSPSDAIIKENSSKYISIYRFDYNNNEYDANYEFNISIFISDDPNSSVLKPEEAPYNNEQNVTIGSISATRRIGDRGRYSLSSLPLTSYIFRNGNITISIVTDEYYGKFNGTTTDIVKNDQSINVLVAKILSTFRFIGRNQQTDMTNWETFTNTKYRYSINIPPLWKPDRSYPGGQYTNSELQELDVVSWNNNSSRLSIQILNDCSATKESCFKKYQENADIQGGPYSSSKTTVETVRYVSQEGLMALSSYGGSENVVKGFFFIRNGKLWLLETQNPPSEKQKLEPEINIIFSTLQLR